MVTRCFAAGVVLFGWLSLHAQTPCAAAVAWMPCDFTVELTPEEAAAHPKPYETVQLRAEFRAPSKMKTYLIPAFWDGGRKLIIRMGPTDAGTWSYKLASNLKRLDGKEGTLQVAESTATTHVHNANVHHWQNALKKQHLWMGDTTWRIGFVPRAQFETMLTARAGQLFTHVRGLVLGEARDFDLVWHDGAPVSEYFHELDERVRELNAKNIIFDAVIAETPGVLEKIGKTRQERERFVNYIVSRYGPFNVTWEIARRFEGTYDWRPIVKLYGEAFKTLDPYEHPKSTDAAITSSPLLGDQWMNFIVSTGANYDLAAIEHQLYQLPQVNGVIEKDADAQRKALWTATMAGQYPEREVEGDAGADAWKHWYEFFADTRYWELEPYFDVDGGRAVALNRDFDPEDIDPIEFIVYVEKPGPVEVRLPRHGYNLRWFNPVNGEWTVLKDIHTDKWAGEPPTSDHDWVLHISRESRKASMLNSYRFDSRPVPVQEVDSKVPYDILAPASDELSVSKPAQFEARIRRETRASRFMLYLWTAEVAAEGQGFRVLGTGAKGTFQVPPDLAKNFPATLLLRLAALNANGKVYMTDKIYKLVP
ncbi:MAG TPA: DUF5060 domain-containing protein [Bryobacteraceae bacterium]|jgi:hypothetical protein